MRRRDNKDIVARAPIENPVPGQWMKWNGRGWDAPGLGGAGAGLIGNVGTSSAYWTEGNVILLLAPSASFRLSMSEDKVHFATVAEPLILYDEDNWQRPAPSELYAYPSMVADQGVNDIGDHFFLTYMYVPPGEDFSQRYLVVQEAGSGRRRYRSFRRCAPRLSRWVDSDGRTWTTTGPHDRVGRSYTYPTISDIS